MVSMAKPSVFISHSTRDKTLVRAFKEHLDGPLEVVMDERDLNPAQNIWKFCTESVKQTDATIVVVSRDSLSSPWVVLEAVEALRSRPDRLIACAIDGSFADADVRADITDHIDAKRHELDDTIKKHLDKDLGLEDLVDARQLLLNMRHNLGDLLKQLRDTFTLGLSQDSLARVAGKVVSHVKTLADPLVLTTPSARANEVRQLISSGRSPHRLEPFLDLATEFASTPSQVEHATSLVRDLRRAEPGTESAQILNRAILEEADRLEESGKAGRARDILADLENRGIVVDCVKLQKRYQKFSLVDITCQVRDGEVLGVFGRNASGKSTLLRLIAGQLLADDGMLMFPAICGNTSRPSWFKVHQHVAYVPQELPHWHGRLRDNLHYEAAIRGVRGVDNQRAVDLMIERLDLSGEIDKRWSELSGGFRLRFALARALVWRPRLLLLDEPLANLDPVVKARVLDDLRRLANLTRHPLAVVIASQDCYDLEEISDRSLFLESGRVRYWGDPKHTGLGRAVNRYHVVGNLQIEDIRMACADLNGVDVRRIGGGFMLSSSLDVSAHSVMRCILAARLPVISFRDISNSVVSLMIEASPWH